MENHIRHAMESIERNDYSSALIHINGVYSRLYSEKRKISLLHPSKSHIRIANSNCIRYKGWRDSFFSADDGAVKILEAIEEHSATSGKDFTTIDGDNILKKARAMRNHCSLFASMQKIKLKKENQQCTALKTHQQK